MQFKESGFLKFFVEHRTSANIIMILMIVVGLLSIGRLNKQFFPDFDVEVVAVTIDWPGATAEEIDQNIVSTVIDPLERQASNGEPYRVFVCPDHPTFCSTRMHSRGLVPFIIAGSGVDAMSAQSYDEQAVAIGHPVSQGSPLIGTLFEATEA